MTANRDWEEAFQRKAPDDFLSVGKRYVAAAATPIPIADDSAPRWDKTKRHPDLHSLHVGPYQSPSRKRATRNLDVMVTQKPTRVAFA